MIREILIWPDPILKQAARPVERVDDTIRRLLDDMAETMYAADGVGLAAPQIAVLKRAGLDPLLWVRNSGSYPGYVFTDPPLKLASGHYGLGHGSGAHAPDEYFVIEASNPKVAGWDGAVASFVDYLYELAAIR